MPRFDRCQREDMVEQIQGRNVGKRLEMRTFANFSFDPPRASIDGGGKTVVGDIFVSILRAC